jgi:hypothetical protein
MPSIAQSARSACVTSGMISGACQRWMMRSASLVLKDRGRKNVGGAPAAMSRFSNCHTCGTIHTSAVADVTMIGSSTTARRHPVAAGPGTGCLAAAVGRAMAPLDSGNRQANAMRECRVVG